MQTCLPFSLLIIAHMYSFSFFRTTSGQWTGRTDRYLQVKPWVSEITGWRSSLQENNQSFSRNLWNIPQISKKKERSQRETGGLGNTRIWWLCPKISLDTALRSRVFGMRSHYFVKIVDSFLKQSLWWKGVHLVLSWFSLGSSTNSDN